MLICTPIVARVTARANTVKKKNMQNQDRERRYEYNSSYQSNDDTSSTDFFGRLEERYREKEREREELKKKFLNAYECKFKLNKVASSKEYIEYEINVPIVDFGFKTISNGRGYTNILILKNQFSDYIPVGTLYGYTKTDKFVNLHVCFSIEEDLKVRFDVKIQFADAIIEDLLAEAVEKHYNMASVHMFTTDDLLSESVEKHYNMDSLQLL